MRLLRYFKRVTAVLLFLCMTIKIHLEVKMLHSSRNNSMFTPWWGNETVGHLRAFPKRHAKTTHGGLHTNHTDIMTDALPNFTSKPLSEKNNSASPNRTRTLTKSSQALRLRGNSLGSAQGKSTSASGGVTKTASRQGQGVDIMFARLKIDDGKKVRDTDLIYSNYNKTYISVNLGAVDKKESPKSAELETKSISKEAQKPSRHSLQGKGSKLPSVIAHKLAKSEPAKKKNTRGVSHDVDSKEVSLSKEAIENIKKEIAVENENQTVYNENRYGPILQNTAIILVQVHNRLENLRHLVQSLRAARGVEQAVVVFSHDYWDPAINTFVRNITEFRVMQMFFPFSIQLHPFTYPGRDPRDCSWNTKREEKQQQCVNQDWPDSYGHYREASFTQIKHHWWWKAHRVFEGLRVTRTNYTGHVIFLEEDHYVTPDLLHVLGLMRRLKLTLCPACKVLALGNYNKLNARTSMNFVERGDWWVNRYNLGFAMDLEAWQTLAPCKAHFCNFDDYNWDWTLNNVVQVCLQPRRGMLSLRLSRVLHVGSCGTHVKRNGCNVEAEVRAAVVRISASSKWLFPETLVLQGSYKSSGKPKKGNGGWGDYRDRQLCHAIGNSTASEATLATLQALSETFVHTTVL